MKLFFCKVNVSENPPISYPSAAGRSGWDVGPRVARPSLLSVAQSRTASCQTSHFLSSTTVIMAALKRRHRPPLALLDRCRARLYLGRRGRAGCLHHFATDCWARCGLFGRVKFFLPGAGGGSSSLLSLFAYVLACAVVAVGVCLHPTVGFFFFLLPFPSAPPPFFLNMSVTSLHVCQSEGGGVVVVVRGRGRGCNAGLRRGRVYRAGPSRAHISDLHIPQPPLIASVCCSPRRRRSWSLHLSALLSPFCPAPVITTTTTANAAAGCQCCVIRQPCVLTLIKR